MKKATGLISLIAFAACSEIPPQAYTNRGDPERLLQTSTEMVTMNVDSPAAMAKFSAMVDRDPPSSAVLTCAQSDHFCLQANSLLDKHHIHTDWTDSSGNSVQLIYQRVTVRDCDPRYIDNSINPYNLHPPTFGCSVNANSLNMASNKRQYTDPDALDPQDGEKTAQAYEQYLKPAGKEPPPPAGFILSNGVGTSQ